MSLLLVTSIAVRVGTVVWSLALLRRIRDLRLLFLTATFALMALRQMLTFREGVIRDGWAIEIPGDIAELPGLAVSVLAAVALNAVAEMILERRANRRKLREREKQLLQAQKMEAIGQLAGSVAHDFNNLLTVVFANTRLAAAGLPPDHERVQHLDAIRDAGERGARLIRQLLAFSRRHPVEPRPIDLSDAVIDLSPVITQLAGAGVELVTLPAASPMIVEADRTQLEQIVVNLVVNARNAMPDGGTVRLQVRGERLSKSDAAEHGVAPGEYVCLRVADAGVGMSEEVQARCFEPFFTTRTGEGGTGLGLATCYGIAKHSNGFVTVDSAVGEGCTIRVYLPRLSTLASKASSSEVANPLNRPRVLLVDDDADVRDAICAMLMAHNYDVTAVPDAASANRVATESEEFELLVTEVGLTDARGDLLAAELRTRYPGLKVLLVSGAAAVDPESDFPLLAKPFSHEVLARRVGQLLGAREQASIAREQVSGA